MKSRTSKSSESASSRIIDGSGEGTNTNTSGQPTPKKRRKPSSSSSTSNKKKKSSKQKTAVTPSPVQKHHVASRRHSPRLPTPSPWLAHDDSLRGVVEDQDNGGSSHVQRKMVLLRYHHCYAFEALVKDSLFSRPFGVRGHATDDDEDKDSIFSRPLGVHGHVTDDDEDEHVLDEMKYVSFDRSIFLKEWQRYADDLARYPAERLAAVKEEFTRDKILHAGLLRKLIASEMNERRYGGTRYYLRALHCMLLDAFERCSVPAPPLPRWNLVLDPNRKTRRQVYWMQLRAWEGHKSRAFAVLEVAKEAMVERHDLPPIAPLKHRGEMVPMNEECKNEESVISFKYDWSIEKSNPPPPLPGAKTEEDEVEWWDDGPICNCHNCKKMFPQERTEREFWEHNYFLDDDDDESDP
mmetsp:Transcript_18505/g.44540  ORF Transcript_18505/g.44540 Transcript_18505/m.44540 type:complete len:409 (-) Transcript_18505:159-1385(-)